MEETGPGAKEELEPNCIMSRLRFDKNWGFDQSDEETWPDQHFDNFWQFLTIFDNFWQFQQFSTILTILTILDNFDNFW